MQMTIGSEEEACGLQRRDELARLRDCRPGIGDSDGFRIPSGTRSGQVHGILAHAQIPDGKCVIGRIVSDDIRQQSARASGQNGVTGRDREFRAEINSEFVSGESNVARFHTRMTVKIVSPVRSEVSECSAVADVRSSAAAKMEGL